MSDGAKPRRVGGLDQVANNGSAEDKVEAIFFAPESKHASLLLLRQELVIGH